MRRIVKQSEPNTIRDTRLSPTTNLSTSAAARIAFNQIDKSLVRRQLVTEQGGLCGFCMKRIHDGSVAGRGRDDKGIPTMRIAHRMPIDVSPEGALDWNNLLGSCDGGERSGGRNWTCDAAQGSTAITVDPIQMASVGKLRYGRRRMRAGFFITSDDEEVRRDVDGVDRDGVFVHGTLRLNSGDLPELREAAWNAFRQLCKKEYPNGPYGAPGWRAFLPKWIARRTDGLPEMLGVVEARLQKDGET